MEYCKVIRNKILKSKMFMLDNLKVDRDCAYKNTELGIRALC